MEVDAPAAVPKTTSAEDAREEELESKRERFRKVWLGKVVQAFGSELDQMRKVSRQLSGFVGIVLTTRVGRRNVDGTEVEPLDRLLVIRYVLASQMKGPS
jgi:hypothetical protein